MVNYNVWIGNLPLALAEPGFTNLITRLADSVREAGMMGMMKLIKIHVSKRRNSSLSNDGMYEGRKEEKRKKKRKTHPLSKEKTNPKKNAIMILVRNPLKTPPLTNLTYLTTLTISLSLKSPPLLPTVTLSTFLA